ncbi:MAG: AraC family transcriptional regulator [Balneolaceae bacterium]|nr:AraC family transcriptional regulator [Balneolaceae bacterium]
MEDKNLPPFKLIGLKLDKKTTNQDGQSSIDCGNLWQRFEKEHITRQIPGKENDEIYAVYYEYEGDHMQPFSYFIGCKVKGDADVPENMDSLTIPGQTYRKVVAKGKMPDCISDSWKTIWKSDFNRAYNYDFEVYGERSKNWDNAEVDILVSTD